MSNPCGLQFPAASNVVPFLTALGYISDELP
jgi:hypothetical protein